jgi:hypothetical protein
MGQLANPLKKLTHSMNENAARVTGHICAKDKMLHAAQHVEPIRKKTNHVLYNCCSMLIDKIRKKTSMS